MAKASTAPARASKIWICTAVFGDVILAANDMRHAEINVVNHRGQRVEIGSVLAAEDRIGERGAIDMAVAAHHVVPAHNRRFEAKTPVRFAARRFETRSAPAADRRKAARS